MADGPRVLIRVLRPWRDRGDEMFRRSTEQFGDALTGRVERRDVAAVRLAGRISTALDRITTVRPWSTVTKRPTDPTDTSMADAAELVRARRGAPLGGSISLLKRGVARSLQEAEVLVSAGTVGRADQPDVSVRQYVHRIDRFTVFTDDDRPLFILC